MPRPAVLALAFAVLLPVRPAGAETEVHRTGDRVDVRATAAPVSEVLDRLGRETGMKVTYDGPPPRARISVTLSGVTPAQAVLSVLEGLGLNYVLQMDATAKRVDTLLMVASGGGSSAPSSVGRPPAGPRSIEREPDVAEPEDEAPSEAPVRDVPEERKPVFPVAPPTGGPALPLTMPSPS
ncbi:MAG TPA: hypothetical protein VGQ33_16940, partial [Vicinamibacteria bacterium]|nr:hypothetical protein [Vicinamibacteria bacterium]